MINAQDIKNGTCIRLDGKLYYCIEFLHVKPGKGNTFMRTKLKETGDLSVWKGIAQDALIEVVSDASTETVLFAELPVKVELQVTYTEPGIKGDTATNTLKPATVETGAEVRVPLFINTGETIRIDTRTGEYMERVR